jgi:hypothetical protein
MFKRHVIVDGVKWIPLVPLYKIKIISWKNGGIKIVVIVHG